MKTHQELGITAEEHRALIEVRDYLRGAGKHAHIEDQHKSDLRNPETPKEQRHRFNMNYTAISYDCGSVACIGGHVSLLLGHRVLSSSMEVSKEEASKADKYVYDLQYNDSPLTRLYFPKILHWNSWNSITPEIAAEAIDNVLNEGEPYWLRLAVKYNMPT